MRRLRTPAIAATLLGSAALALAQYRVVGPDGRVTYTDRPPSTADAKVTSIGRTGSAETERADTAALPFELRGPANRFPVVLYSTTECAPCDAARQLLVQRGVPFSEKRITTEADLAALERLIGARTLPSGSIGAQSLRGFASADWAAYLDAAGYPKESRMPRGWQPAAAQPLVPRAAPATAPARGATPAAPPAPPIETAPAEGTTIRF